MAEASRRGGASAARDSLAAAHLLESYLASGPDAEAPIPLDEQDMRDEEEDL